MTNNKSNELLPNPPDFQTSAYTWDKPIEEQFATTSVTHDAFFDMVFQVQEVARSFVQFILPAILLVQLDILNLSVSVRRFRDKNFQEARADMVYEIPLKNNPKKRLKIYIVVEHKSYNDTHSMSQLLKYEAQIIDAEITLAKKLKIYTKDFKLPPIILVIFHHGGGVYTGSVELADEFENIAGTEEFIIKQKGIIFDLSSKSKEELPHDTNVPELYIALRIMQIILNNNIEKILQEENLIEVLKPYADDPKYRQFGRLFAYYVFDNSHNLSEECTKQFNNQLQKTFKGGQFMLSQFAERYVAIGKKQGRAKGIVEGIAEGRIEDIISILDIKFGEVSETVRSSLCAITDIDRLHKLVRVAVKCDTFEEFSKSLANDAT
ncbi:MAG: Rpn family recombination-promoting nuclease/putative transposase [Planctomycetaceae bacterium]|jgi:hypothetical protein|nr:Rpn family recombination-promoting nuclease/putative transposase [Planctomycetaceae bacterium]